MSEAARKPLVDIEEFERQLRPSTPSMPAPNARLLDDPLAELARLVAETAPAPKAEAVKSHVAPVGLTSDEQQFLDELTLAVDRDFRKPVVASASQAEPRLPAAAFPAEEAFEPASLDLDFGPQVVELRGALGDALQTDAPQAPVVVEPIAAPTFEAPPQDLPEATFELALADHAPRQSEAPPVSPELAPSNAKAPLVLGPLAAAVTAPALAPVRAFELPKQKRLDAPEPALRAAEPPLGETRPSAPTDLDEPGRDYDFEPAAPALSRASGGKGFGLSRAAMIAALLGGGALLLGGGLALRGGGKSASGEPPTIMASTQPVKVAPPAVPAEASGASADAKPVGDSAARVVTSAEEPLDLAREAQKKVRVVPMGAGGQSAASAPETPPITASGFPEPKRVRTVTVRPDGSIVGVPTIAPAPAPAQVSTLPSAPPPGVQAAPALAAPAPARASAPAPATSIASAPVQAQTPAPSRADLAEPDAGAKPKPSAATPAAKPPAAPKPQPKVQAAKPPAPKPTELARAPVAPEPEADPADDVEQVSPLLGRGAAPAASSQPMRIAPETTASAGPAETEGGGYAVQLSASPNEAEARANAQKLQARFGGEFGGRGPSVRKADVGGKTVYRVRVGGLSKESATSLCGRLQSAGGACFVARN